MEYVIIALLVVAFFGGCATAPKNGLGVVQDYAEALKWFRKAADQGHIRFLSKSATFFFLSGSYEYNSTE